MTLQDSVPAPNYSSGYYQSAACKPNTSEQRILSSYAEFLTYPRTERDMITTLQNEEEKQPREFHFQLQSIYCKKNKVVLFSLFFFFFFY